MVFKCVGESREGTAICQRRARIYRQISRTDPRSPSEFGDRPATVETMRSLEYRVVLAARGEFRATVLAVTSLYILCRRTSLEISRPQWRPYVVSTVPIGPRTLVPLPP